MCLGMWECYVPSLYIAVTVGPIGLSHVHAAHRQAHAIDGVTSGWHPLVDPVQTFGLLETADPMLWGEATDGCKDMRTHAYTQTQTYIHTHTQNEYLTKHLLESCVFKPFRALWVIFRALK